VLSTGNPRDLTEAETAGPGDRAAGTRRADRPWRRAFGFAASVWAAASIGYFLINGMTWMMLRQSGPRLGGALGVWDQWDTGHYIKIALYGYKNVAPESPAFFPLYPLMVRYLEPILPGGGLSAGLIISHAACLGALTILFRLVEDLLGVALARRTVVFLMAYPFAFFLVTAYNEAVFLFFSVAAFYLMRRGNWWAAGAVAALASATRQAGVLLAVAFVVEYLRQRDWRLSGPTRWPCSSSRSAWSRTPCGAGWRSATRSTSCRCSRCGAASRSSRGRGRPAPSGTSSAPPGATARSSSRSWCSTSSTCWPCSSPARCSS
jgi:hypothetical protein